MADIHIPVDKNNDNVANYIRSYSYFNEDQEQRLISGDQLSSRVIEQNIEGQKKSTIVKRVDEYKHNGFLIKSDVGNFYIVMEPQGSYIALPIEFVKKMIKTFNSNTNKIYVWLYRRYHYYRSQGKHCYFTKGQICVEALGQSDQTANRQKVEIALTQLALNGLIRYSVLRYGETFLRELNFIGTEFVIADAVEQKINLITENGRETKIDATFNEEFIEGQPLLAVGFNIMPSGILAEQDEILKKKQFLLE